MGNQGLESTGTAICSLALRCTDGSKGKEQAIAQVNAIAGAIAPCEEFLRDIPAHVPPVAAQQTPQDTPVPKLSTDVATTSLPKGHLAKTAEQ